MGRLPKPLFSRERRDQIDDGDNAGRIEIETAGDLEEGGYGEADARNGVLEDVKVAAGVSRPAAEFSAVWEPTAATATLLAVERTETIVEADERIKAANEDTLARIMCLETESAKRPRDGRR